MNGSLGENTVKEGWPGHGSHECAATGAALTQTTGESLCFQGSPCASRGPRKSVGWTGGSADGLRDQQYYYGTDGKERGFEQGEQRGGTRERDWAVQSWN